MGPVGNPITIKPWPLKPLFHAHFFISSLVMWAQKRPTEKKRGSREFFAVLIIGISVQANSSPWSILLSLSPHISVSSSFKFWILLLVISTPYLEREGMSMFNVQLWMSIDQWWTLESFEFKNEFESLLIYINFSTHFFHILLHI